MKILDVETYNILFFILSTFNICFIMNNLGYFWWMEYTYCVRFYFIFIVMTSVDTLRELLTLHWEHPDIDWDSLTEKDAKVFLNLLFSGEQQRESAISEHLNQERLMRKKEHEKVNNMISKVVSLKNKIKELKEREKDNSDVLDIENILDLW